MCPLRCSIIFRRVLLLCVVANEILKHQPTTGQMPIEYVCVLYCALLVSVSACVSVAISLNPLYASLSRLEYTVPLFHTQCFVYLYM